MSAHMGGRTDRQVRGGDGTGGREQRGEKQGRAGRQHGGERGRTRGKREFPSITVGNKNLGLDSENAILKFTELCLLVPWCIGAKHKHTNLSKNRRAAVSPLCPAATSVSAGPKFTFPTSLFFHLVLLSSLCLLSHDD